MRFLGAWVLLSLAAASSLAPGCGGSSADDGGDESDSGLAGEAPERGGNAGRGGRGGASGAGTNGGTSDGGQPDGGFAGDGGSSGSSNGGAATGGSSTGGSDAGRGGTSAGSSGEGGTGGDPECVNSLDCPPGLVCDRDRALCVECLQDGDCATDERCALEECRKACASDNQCTPLGLLCDIIAGYCVRCVSHFDCTEAQYCDRAECVPDVCTSGATRCESTGLATCNSFGSAWSAPVACGSRQSCSDAFGAPACAPWICEPGAMTCDQETVAACSSDGLTLTPGVDCSDDDQVCVGGACHEVICGAGARFCEGSQVRQCSAKGESSQLVQTCSGQLPACHPGLAACAARVCTPDAPSCDRNVATTCDATGTGFVGTRTNCRQVDQYCDDGNCAACAGGWASPCSELPRFTASAQVVDGVGDEFCNVPALEGRVAALPWLHPTYRNTTLTATYELRAAWSDLGLHAHVRIAKSVVNGYSYPNNDLWRGDTVQFYLAGTSTLTGAFGSTQDGGARHLSVAAPSTSYPNGRGVYQTSSTAGVYSAAPASHFVARATAEGYEVEVQIPWQSNAAPRSSGARFGFDFSVTVNDTSASSSASTPGLEGVLNNPLSTTATCNHPYCDDRAWCLPFLE